MADLHHLTLTQALSAMTSGEVSPVTLVSALLQRIETSDHKIKAWETVDGERALQAARASEARFASRAVRPLEGLPLGIKDIFLTKGMRTQAGFAPFSNFIPDHDAEAVAKLRAAGAIILGKTVTTQFAFMDPPITTNPWKEGHTPGGSSSGSAAAVAARMVPAALGTQTSGSVLRPAAFCGVIGYKPSFGLISRRGVFPDSWSLDHVGVITRSVEDAALLAATLFGRDPQDPASLTYHGDDLATLLTKESASPRIGILSVFLARAKDDVAANTRATIERLVRAGAKAEEVDLPVEPDLVMAVHRVIMQTEMASIHAQMHARSAEDYAPLLRAYVEVGQLIPGASYVHAQRLRRRIRQALTTLSRRYDVLLLPTVSSTAPDTSTTGDPSFQGFWTLVGFPSISMPSGLSKEGLPYATQLVAAPFQDARLLTTARWCHSILGGIPAPPGIPS